MTTPEEAFRERLDIITGGTALGPTLYVIYLRDPDRAQVLLDQFEDARDETIRTLEQILLPLSIPSIP